MAEYIDREAAFHKLKHFIAQDWFHSIELHAMCQYETCNPTEFARGYEQGALDAATVITGYPAADVVEIPKGITNDLGLAVKGLGIFRLSWCVKSLEDDIEFRCSECPFEDKRTNKCSLKILLKRLATEEEWHKFSPLV